METGRGVVVVSRSNDGSRLGSIRARGAAAAAGGDRQGAVEGRAERGRWRGPGVESWGGARWGQVKGGQRADGGAQDADGGVQGAGGGAQGVDGGL